MDRWRRQTQTQKKMDKELEFILKVVRNGAILAGLYFISAWAATSELSFIVVKPIIIFLGTYILTEFTKRYGIDKEEFKKQKDRSVNTLLF